MIKKVSVVMCTYNGEQFLREQLDSILNQTYPIYEVIIQDDCSIDNTALIIEEYAKKHPIIIPYINKKQQGINQNFYSAISKAKGDYIAISDQDDIWEIKKIEKQLLCIGDNLLCFSFSKPFIEGITSVYFDKRIPNYSAERMMFISVAPGHTILMHSSLIDKIAPLTHFDCFVYDAVLQIVAALEQRIVFCPEILVHQRRHIDAATYTVPLDYSKSIFNMLRTIHRTIKLYIEIRTETRELFKKRHDFVKAIPVDDYKKKNVELLTFHMKEKGFLNYVKKTILCVRLKDKLFYTKEKSIFLSVLRGLYFPISSTDYFRYLSIKEKIK